MTAKQTYVVKGEGGKRVLRPCPHIPLPCPKCGHVWDVGDFEYPTIGERMVFTFGPCDHEFPDGTYCDHKWKWAATVTLTVEVEEDIGP